MKKEYIYRAVFYMVGMMVLAAGITLNTKTDLGVSPIISVSFVIAQLTGSTVGNITFIWYCVLVLMEIIIHIFMRKYSSIVYDLAQIIISLIFTRFMNLYAYIIPNLRTDLAGTIWAELPGRILVLIIAIILTGIGAALSLNARLIPNPGDGIVQAFADLTKKTTGFIKNCVDFSCVIISSIIGIMFAHQLLGIGIGTIFAMIGVGRVIAIFNHYTQKPIAAISGVLEENES